jgi:hypothetical protein
MTNVKAKGSKKIDLLGIHTDGHMQDDSCHVEVSSWSSGNLSGRGSFKFHTPLEVVRHFSQRKFLDWRIRQRVRELVGDEYRRIWVVNSLLQLEKHREKIRQLLYQNMELN